MTMGAVTQPKPVDADHHGRDKGASDSDPAWPILKRVLWTVLGVVIAVGVGALLTLAVHIFQQIRTNELRILTLEKQYSDTMTHSDGYQLRREMESDISVKLDTINASIVKLQLQAERVLARMDNMTGQTGKGTAGD